MSWPATIGDYYRAAREQAKQEIATTSDAKVLGMEPTAWLDYLVARWGMVPIELDGSPRLLETERQYRLRAYDFQTDRQPGTLVTEIGIAIHFTVQPSDTIQTIWSQKYTPNTFSMSHGYPPFQYDHNPGRFIHTVTADPNEVKRGIEFIRETIAAYNRSIEEENLRFRPEIERLVHTRRERLVAKHKSLDDLAAAVGIPLTKKADPASVVPIAPRVKPTISAVLPPPVKPPTRPVLEADKFKAILELIDNSGRQFERTPQAFATLTEEGLRDIMLSNLNAVFAGAATGETFQGVGKCDIHLRISQGEVFIAELKFWTGPESIKEVIEQLRGRLSWRDAYGVAVVLARNAKFTEVMNSAAQTIASCDGFVGTLVKPAENHTVARFNVASDASRLATIHVLVYNLYLDESHGARIVKSKRSPRRAVK